MRPANLVMVAVVMTRYHQKWYITRHGGSAQSSSISGRVCVADAFRESGTANETPSLELSQLPPLQHASSCSELTHIPAPQSIPLSSEPARVRENDQS